LLGLAVAKFGNPAILDHLTTRPASFWQYVYFSWPLGWAYVLLLLTGLASARWMRWRSQVPLWLALLPLAWLLWQGVAALDTVSAELTRATLPYLLATTACYYLGLTALDQRAPATWFWGPFLVGFVFMLAMGLEQRFGGLEATRQQLLSNPEALQRMPAEFVERINKLRVFATLLYPNALAGVLLLLLPAMTVALWRLLRVATPPSRALLCSLFALAGLGCLYWSKSKAGWLVALVMAGAAFWRLPLRTRWKTVLTVAVLGLGLTAFFLRFADYFERGATSVGARFDYYQAAARTFADHPLTGSGPGTFKEEYERRKPPEAEMARLTHNDYLQQASDSGLPGALAYAALVWGSLAWLWRRSLRDPLPFAVWLGLLGWALQSFVEFGLYIPPIGWSAFLLLGWLSTQRINPHLIPIPSAAPPDRTPRGGTKALNEPPPALGSRFVTGTRPAGTRCWLRPGCVPVHQRARST
jgi:O-antigen ligase